MKPRNPWAWIPTLYFGQGIPYVVVMSISVIMYKKMGISNTDIALYTSWLYLPWVIKPLWSPFVDMFRTKRFWIVTLQLLIGAALAGVAFTIPLPSFFQITLAVFWLMAFSSATHDIAADGFYMLALEQHQQAAFVGVRSTFYRIAMIMGQGALIIFAGYIESHSGLPPVEIKINAEYSNVSINRPILINDETPSKKISDLQIYSPETNYKINTTPISKQKFDSLTSNIKNKNDENGFTSKPKEVIQISEESFWEQNVSKPLARYLRETFNPDKVKSANEKGNIILIPFRISQKLEQGREVVFTFSHLRGDNNFSVIEGERFVFTSENWDKVAFAVVQVDYKLKQNSEATFVGKSGNIPLSWSITFFLLTGIFISLAIYHKFVLPYPVSDKPTVSDASHNVFKEFIATFGSFFKKKNIGVILAFLLLYRFAEAQLVKLVTPFLLDPRIEGGLGLTTQEVGIVYGTVGVIALTLGGLLGGVVIAKRGLKFWLWIMVCVIHFPDAMFVYLSQVQPENFYFISAAVAIEQFGYGFGFTAYMLFMIMTSEGEHKTAHYAICTGFMALGMMLPGMFSGWLQDQIGYQNFFLWIMASTIPGFAVAAFVKIPEEFGKKKA